jgi:hypothetical protein
VRASRLAIAPLVVVGAALGASLGLAASGCKDRPPPAAEIADRAWRAHELVVAAGEHEPTCAAAGAAMQRAFAAHRQAFVDGIELDRDRARLEEATDYIAEHERRYRDLETRMIALSERCADEPSVVAVFRMMESPTADPAPAPAPPPAPPPPR